MVAQQPPISPPSHIDEAMVRAFRESLRGEVLLPGDKGYDAARTIWNAMIDRRPSLIARCADSGDVVASVQFAREHDLPVAVRAGGHGVAGKAISDGGLTIDLSPMQELEIDPARRTAKAEAGLTWGTFDREAQAFGLATTGGIVPSTGIAGLTLGGGLGYIMRSCGLACDNLLSAEMVTADGRELTASAEENADLFWGLRGGGGNFGIVTKFEFRLHPVGPTVLGGLILHPAAQRREAARFYREFAVNAPDELTTHLAFVTSPDGHPVVGFLLCYNGPLEEGERVIKPLREFGSPVADLVAPLPYLAMQGLGESMYPQGRRNYWKSNFIKEFSDDAIETMVAQAADVPSPFSGMALEQMGGAIKRVGADETAFGDRSADYSVIITTAWEDPATSDENIQWARDFAAAMEPFTKEGAYINYLDTGDDGRVRAAYGDAKYERLVALKNKYDPTNFFRLNQNIPPSV
jgi:FAD/FMN-containing dehydrogenase